MGSKSIIHENYIDMYLVGTFERWHSETFEDYDPMQETKVLKEITKKHLAEAQKDDRYQVINLDTLEFYNPKTNQWRKLVND